MFKNRKIIIATKHQKEQVIAPLLEKELGLNCFVDPHFDTDVLGTFTGEIEREFDPVATAREKCLRAMQLNDCDLGIASEGSFGAHPSYFFLNADDEIIIFIDRLNKLEIVAREISTDTNFNARELVTEDELIRFAQEVGFPEHGIILRKSKVEMEDIYKGITDFDVLKNTFKQLIQKGDSVYAETDMRALYNPKRMKVIEKATIKLLKKINSKCPSCQMPGFEITEAVSGLACSQCGAPTNSALYCLYVCKHCKFSEKQMYPEGKKTEDPAFCDYCNP